MLYVMSLKDTGLPLHSIQPAPLNSFVVPSSPKRVHFGMNPVEAVAHGVALIDSSHLLQLMVTDLAAMVIPRTYLEYRERGPDMGRETLIRELGGTVTNVFLAGWFGLLGAMAYTVSPFINPQKLPGRAAFINMPLLNGYSDLTRSVLREHVKTDPSLSAKQLRQQLVTSWLKSLNDGYQHPLPKTLQTLLKGNPTRYTHQEQEALNAIHELFTQKPSAHNGSYALDTIVDELLGPNAKPDERLKLRLKLSKDSSSKEKLWYQQLKPRLKQLGLTERVDLALNELDSGNTLNLNKRELSNVSKQFKRYLEQYVDRSIAELTHQRGQTLDWDKPLYQLFGKQSGSEAATLLEQKLLGEHSRWVLDPRRYIPEASDGLLRYAEKQKIFTTAIPLFMTTALSVGLTYVNAWITRKKNGGKDFFPGDEPHIHYQTLQKTAPQLLQQAQKTKALSPKPVALPLARLSLSQTQRTEPVSTSLVASVPMSNQTTSIGTSPATNLMPQPALKGYGGLS